MNPKQKGEVSQAIVLAELAKAEKSILLPWGDNQPYDIAIEENGKLIRIQVKPGILKNGVILANACSSSCAVVGRAKTVRRNYKGRADMFAICCFQTQKVYLVPVDEVGNVGVSLRIDPPRNRQVRRIRWARDYELNG